MSREGQVKTQITLSVSESLALLLQKQKTAKGVAWIVLKEVMRLHGLPEYVVSDRDAQFTSIFWRDLQKLMGTKLCRIRA